MAYCRELIVTEERRGEGTPESQMRVVLQVFDKNGTLVAEKDPLAPIYDLVNDSWTPRTRSAAGVADDDDLIHCPFCGDKDYAEAVSRPLSCAPIEISEVEKLALDRLVEVGLFGISPPEVAERLLSEALRQMVKDGWLKL